MSKKKYVKIKKPGPPQPAVVKKPGTGSKQSLLPWLLAALGVTAICLFPMLQNEFTGADAETKRKVDAMIEKLGSLSNEEKKKELPMNIITWEWEK